MEALIEKGQQSAEDLVEYSSKLCYEISQASIQYLLHRGSSVCSVHLSLALSSA
jgi:hypothetical protein